MTVVEQDAVFRAPSASAGNCGGGNSYPWGTLPYGRPPVASPQSIACSDPDPRNDTGGAGVAPRCRDNWGLDLIDQRTLARNGTYTFQVVGGVDRFGNLRTRHGSGDLVEDHCNQAAQPYELDCGSNVGGCIDVWAPASSPDKLLYSKVP